MNNNTTAEVPSQEKGENFVVARVISIGKQKSGINNVTFKNINNEATTSASFPEWAYDLALKAFLDDKYIYMIYSDVFSTDSIHLIYLCNPGMQLEEIA